MILLGNILIGLAKILGSVMTVISLLIIARAVISWVNADRNNGIVRFITASTDPIFNVVNRRVSLSAGGIDFTPIVLLLALYFLQYALVETLIAYGLQMRTSGL